MEKPSKIKHPFFGPSYSQADFLAKVPMKMTAHTAHFSASKLNRTGRMSATKED
jgi:hypothetical protein